MPPGRLQSLVTRLIALEVPILEGPGGVALQASDLISEEAITRDLAERGIRVPVAVRRICDSTNRLAAIGPVPAFHFAEMQTAGRGRRGQAWRQPFAAGVALSFAAPVPAGRLDGLAVALAVAAAEALQGLGYLGIRLKWPNDLYAGEAKLGGLMVQVEGGRAPRLVAGLGVNVHRAPQLSDRATAALVDCGPDRARNSLAVALAVTLADGLERFRRDGFPAFAPAYRRLDLLAGRAVRLSTPAGAVEGVVRGIGDVGEIAIETPAGVHHYTAGEVSLGACPPC